MAVIVSDVRAELQLPSNIISDEDISYVIAKITVDDINLVCAEVLRMVLRKYRGRVRERIGKYTVEYSGKELRSLIRSYVAKSGTFDDGVEYDDPVFEQDGL